MHSSSDDPGDSFTDSTVTLSWDDDLVDFFQFVLWYWALQGLKHLDKVLQKENKVPVLKSYHFSNVIFSLN